MKKLEEVDLQPEERQKVRSQNGAWFVTCDQKKIYYAGILSTKIVFNEIVLADSAYPERHCYGFMKV